MSEASEVYGLPRPVNFEPEDEEVVHEVTTKIVMDCAQILSALRGTKYIIDARYLREGHDFIKNSMYSLEIARGFICGTTVSANNPYLETK